MKKYIVSIILVAFFNFSISAQDNEKIALQSLEFLNQKFHLNLEKENEPILIAIDGYEYICYKYINHDSLPLISRLKRKYNLHKLDDTKYEFIFSLSSKYSGTFEILVDDDMNFKFFNLNYIKGEE